MSGEVFPTCEGGGCNNARRFGFSRCSICLMDVVLSDEPLCAEAVFYLRDQFGVEEGE